MPNGQEPETPGVVKYHVVRVKKDGRTHYFNVAIRKRDSNRPRSGSPGTDTKAGNDGTH